MDKQQIDTIIQTVENLPLKQAFAYLETNFPNAIVFSTSLGLEDQVLTDILSQQEIKIRIFTLDTGRLFPESYDLLDKTIARYKQPIQVFFPDAALVEAYTSNKGINAFYESVDNRKECCTIRKIAPLERALSGAKVWVTGLRADQSLNRKNMPLMAWDKEKQIFKYNPLINWTTEALTNYINEHHVPLNPLHKKGFPSIGCAPCTRAIEPDEDPRAGRWWWENSHKECGLHSTRTTS